MLYLREKPFCCWIKGCESYYWTAQLSCQFPFGLAHRIFLWTITGKIKQFVTHTQSSLTRVVHSLQLSTSTFLFSYLAFLFSGFHCKDIIRLMYLYADVKSIGHEHKPLNITTLKFLASLVIRCMDFTVLMYLQIAYHQESHILLRELSIASLHSY